MPLVQQPPDAIDEGAARRAVEGGARRARRRRGGPDRRRGHAAALDRRLLRLEELRPLVLDLARRSELHAVHVAALELQSDATARAGIGWRDQERSELTQQHRLDAEDAARALLDLRELHGTVLTLGVLVLEALCGVAAPERLARDGAVALGQ